MNNEDIHSPHPHIPLQIGYNQLGVMAFINCWRIMQFITF